MSDADTEEALAEFDFLVSVSHDGAGEARSQADTDWGNLSVVMSCQLSATKSCIQYTQVYNKDYFDCCSKVNS